MGEVVRASKFDKGFITALSDLYITFRGRFVEMRDGSVFIPKEKGRPITLKDSHISSHLAGIYAVGVYAGEKSSKFMTFDVDNGSVPTVRDIIGSLVNLGISEEYIQVSTSGGKGYHIDLICESPIATWRFRAIYEYVCNELELDTHKIEFRPTSSQSIKLPLGVHHKTGNRCWFLNKKTMEPVEDMGYIFSIDKIPYDVINSISSRCYSSNKFRKEKKEKERIQRIHEGKELPREYEDHIVDLTGQGQFRNTAVKVGIFLRTHGEIDFEGLKIALFKWYESQNPDYINESENEAKYYLNHLAKWVTEKIPERNLFYRKDEPIPYTADDMRLVMAQSSIAGRRIMFLIMNLSKRYGWCTLSEDRISEYIGFTRQTVTKTVSALVESGAVKKEAGGYYNPNRRRPNLLRPVYRGELPSCERVSSVKADTNISVPPLTPENFEGIFYGTVKEAVGEEKLTKVLTKKERSEISEVGLVS